MKNKLSILLFAFFFFLLFTGCVEVRKNDGSSATYLIGIKIKSVEIKKDSLEIKNDTEDVSPSPQVLGYIKGTDVLLRPTYGFEEREIMKKLTRGEKVIILDTVIANSKDWVLAIEKIEFEGKDGEAYEIDNNQKVKIIDRIGDTLKVEVMIDNTNLTALIDKSLVREINNPKFYKIRTGTDEGWIFSELVSIPGTH